MSPPAGRTGPAAAHVLRWPPAARGRPRAVARRMPASRTAVPWPRRGQRRGHSPAAGRDAPPTMSARHRRTGEPVRPHLPTGTPIRARQAGCPRPDLRAAQARLPRRRPRTAGPAAQPVSRSARRRPVAAASDRSRPASAGFSSIRAPQTGGYRRPAQSGSMKSQSPGWRVRPAAVPGLPAMPELPQLTRGLGPGSRGGQAPGRR